VVRPQLQRSAIRNGSFARYAVTALGFGCRGFFGFNHRGTPLNVRQASWPIVGNFMRACVKEHAINSKTLMFCFVQRLLLPVGHVTSPAPKQWVCLLKALSGHHGEAVEPPATELGVRARKRLCYIKI